MIPKKRVILYTLIFIPFILFLSTIGIFLFNSYYQKHYTNRLFPGISFSSVPVGKLTKEEIRQFFETEEAKLKKVSLVISYQNSFVATLSAQQLELRLNIDEVFDRAYTIGRSPYLFARTAQTALGLLDSHRYSFFIEVDFKKQALSDVLNQINDQFGYEAKNARFQFENGKVTQFEQEENGLKIETDYAMALAITSLKRSIQKKSSPMLHIKVSSSIIKPSITLAKINTFGIEELIGEGSSDYTHSISERIHNVLLAASKFNGVLIPTNQVFSFNETLGDVSSSTGYQRAYIIKEGKTVLGDGGGVCQVSTTLFRAALHAGLPIVEHHSHAYRVSYYENDAKPGLDATVFAPTVDLKIKNNTPAYILIQTAVEKENNILRFRFYGKKDGRLIELSTPQISNVFPPPEPLFQDDPTLKKGTVKQVDFAAPSGKSYYSYKVIKRNEILFQKDFLISYRPWRAVFLVGTGE